MSLFIVESTILQIALPVPLRRTFDYLPPPGKAPKASPIGLRVLVPFGKRQLVGVVMGLGHGGASSALKSALRWLDESPLLDAELLETVQFVARYYLAPIGEVVDTALPARLREARPPPSAPVLAYRVREGAPAPTRGAVAIALFAQLQTHWLSASQVLEQFPSARPVLARLLEAKQIEALTRLPDRGRPVIAPPPHHPAQLAAIEGMAASLNAFQVNVLNGVTGSGKTEVYIELAARVLAQGKQVLILVPEIGLTPQTVQRFRERLAGRIVVFHSGLPDGERADAWLAMQCGDAEVAIGTRSAVFTPMRQLGLIVVDEEHDASYKQQDGVRYSARDLAIKRAQQWHCPVVLGSATPSLESMAAVQAKRYREFDLPTRAGHASAPRIELTDLRQQRLQHGLAPAVLEAIEKSLQAGEQVLVFRNRRGYAPALLCHLCGWHAECSRCDRPMTWHRNDNELRCHHCAHHDRVPHACLHCGEAALVPAGVGTERLEETLAQRFAKIPVVRIDRDTTRSKDSLTQQLEPFRHAGPAILIGTQMLAKGHDLPYLSLGVIMNGDEGLLSADFRAEERLAQLIVQVAGRIGRAHRQGRVLLQTHHPQHPLLQRLLQAGYAGFAHEHLPQREAAGFPPFTHLALLRAEATSELALDAFFQAAGEVWQQCRADHNESAEIKASFKAVDVLGPMPSGMPRRAGFLRRVLWLQSNSRRALHDALAPWVLELEELKSARKVRWSLDIDPVEAV